MLLLSCQGEAGSSKVAAPPAKTVITSARIQGHALVIAATYFAPSSNVTLGGTTLQAASSKPNELTAALPESLAPGNYLLSVSGGTPATSDSFTVTVGATGPPGPSGPPGAAAALPTGFLILGQSPTPPKGFVYAGYSVISQVASTGWTLKTPMPTARTGASAAIVKGTLYVIGGAKDQTLQGLSTVEAYDPVTDTWTSKAPMPTARSGAGIGVIDGTIYVIGGSPGINSFSGAFEAYDTVANKWAAKASIPTPKKSVVSAVVNGLLYLIGDFTSFSSPSTASTLGVEAYDPVTDTWTHKAALPIPISNVAVGVMNNMIYAVGGGEDASLTVNEAYDPVSNTWAPKAPMPAPRNGFASGVLNGILYLAGGAGPTELAGSACAYDPMHDSWSTSLTLPIPVESPAGAVSEEGVFYVVGGTGRGGKALTVLQAFSPSGPRFYLHRSQ